MVAYKLPKAKMPIIAVSGESGSGKSSTADQLANIIDTNSNIEAGKPKGDRAFNRGLAANYITTQHNASKYSGEEQNTLCIAASGGTAIEPTMRENGTTTSLDISGPIILAFINRAILTRSDLRDRTVFIELPEPKGKHTSDSIRWSEFKALLPELQALLRGLAVYCLQNWDVSDVDAQSRANRSAEYVIIYNILARLKGEAESYSARARENKATEYDLVFDQSLLAQDIVNVFADGSSNGTYYTRDLIDLLLAPLSRQAQQVRLGQGQYAAEPTKFIRYLRSLSGVLNSHGINVQIADKRSKKGFKITISTL